MTNYRRFPSHGIANELICLANNLIFTGSTPPQFKFSLSFPFSPFLSHTLSLSVSLSGFASFLSDKELSALADALPGKILAALGSRNQNFSPGACALSGASHPPSELSLSLSQALWTRLWPRPCWTLRPRAPWPSSIRS